MSSHDPNLVEAAADRVTTNRSRYRHERHWRLLPKANGPLR